MIEIHDDILREELAKIPPLTRETYFLTDDIAERIDAIMKQKGISKKQLAELTHRRPSDVTRWLGGGHTFTCKPIAMIQVAVEEKSGEVTK